LLSNSVNIIILIIIIIIVIIIILIIIVTNHIIVIIIIITGLIVQTYSSQVIAAAAVGTARSSISKCCHGSLGSTGGFKWQYASRDENNTDRAEIIDDKDDGTSDVEVAKPYGETKKVKKANISKVGNLDLIAARLREYARDKEAKGQKRRRTPVYSINLITGWVHSRVMLS
jgi:hypothetical protein